MAAPPSCPRAPVPTLPSESGESVPARPPLLSPRPLLTRGFPSAHMIHHFAGSVSNMKTRQLPCGSIAFCCSALTTPSGDMYWPAVESKSHSSAKIYSSLFARHWDSWSTPNHNSLWYGLLAKKDDKWTLQSPGVVNLLAGTRLSCPVAPFGDTGDFDLCASGIAFVAKDPDLNAARYTKSDLYYAPVPSFTEKPAALHRVETGRLRGYSLCPTFSRDGKKLAFARMRSDQYESDKPHLLLIPDITDLANVQEFYETADGVGSWDLRPEWITWSHDDSELYVAAEKHARGVLFRLPSSPVQANSLPTPIYEDGSVADAKVLGGSPSLFLSCKSLVESSCYCIVDPDTKSVKEISSISKRGKLLGLSRSQCSEIWYPGSRGYRNHALVMRPSDFDSSKKYPLAFLIHGGPQGAWSDDWSTRWNPGIFAEQGYVVVAPNPTGSTGYGQDHVDAIAGNWGGSPYEDLVKCFDYIEEEMKYVDTDRAVALGASYGGYMISEYTVSPVNPVCAPKAQTEGNIDWIQGHDLGRKFKCLVCHDGVFSTLNQWSTEELFFPEHDFCGTLWGRRDMYEKWDPARHTGNWATPELVCRPG